MTSNEELIAYIQAEMDGKEIQYKQNTEAWYAKNPLSGWNSNTIYRVKPEPREWYVNEYSPGDLGYVLYDTATAAKKRTSDETQQIKIREVLEDDN